MQFSTSKSFLLICFAYIATFFTLYAADLGDGPLDVNDDGTINILVIGSTRSFSDGNESGVVKQKPYNPTVVSTHLESILSQDPAISETVNVVFDDIFKTKFQTVDYSNKSKHDFTSHCYTLAQHYMWPDGKSTRLSNLRGGNGTVWDHVIIMSDPYVMANFPGMYAEGVKLIVDEVKKGVAKPMLFAQWPENSSTFTAANFDEVVYRVGRSSEVGYVPAGKAWNTLTNQDASSAHPTPKGAYLAAASIYSKLCDVSAKTSSYVFTNGSTTNSISDHALGVVQVNQNAVLYTGPYLGNNVFTMKYVTKRDINFRETGTSTEDRLRQALGRADDLYRVNLIANTGSFWDFNYGRGNDWWENDKDYEVNPAKYDRSYGFPMLHYKLNSALNTMPYGIDKHYWNGEADGDDTNNFTSYEDGTDLGIAYNMIRPGTRELGLPDEDVRAIPIRLIWLKMLEQSPGFNPLQDNTHMNHKLNDASAAFMYTLLSGRCPVIEEPSPVGSDAWLQWLGHKVGYETAWQMSHLTTRSPGFRVLPSATSAKTITAAASETMTVRFAYQPKSNVTVNVSLSNPNAAIVGPQKLIFTAENYDIPQNVVIAGVEGVLSREDFEVVYNTVSDDEVYDGLSDSWEYTINRNATTGISNVDKGATQVVAFRDAAVTISLNTSGASSSNTEFAGPNTGVLTWSGSDVIYTPSSGFTGKDGFAFSVTTGGVLTRGYFDIDVLDAAAPGMVAYNGNGNTGGSVPFDSNTYAENDTVIVRGNTGVLVRTGYTFSDWNTALDGSGVSYDGGNTFLMDSAGVLLYAQWLADSYIITYNSNGANSGTVPQSQNKTFGVDVTLANNSGNLTRNGQQFVGWNLASDGSGQFYELGVNFSLNQNTTLYAHWNSLPSVDAGEGKTLVFNGSQAWNPSSLNPESWYDASDASTITATAVGGSVSVWRDKSGNAGRNAVQTTGSNQPTSGSNSMGGLNVITFDGNNDVLNLDLDYLAGVSHSAFVMTKTEAGGFTDIYGAANSNSASSSLHVGFSSATSYRMNFWGNDWGQAIGSSFNVTEGNILNFVWGSGATKQVFANGISQGTGTGAGVITAMAGGGRLGQVVNHGNYGGDIAEVVFVTGNVNIEDRERMEGYLAHKWGVSAGLSAVHPYRNLPPFITAPTVTLVGAAADSDGDALTYTWSGPANVNFSSPNSLTTNASFTEAGVYVLRLTASDGISESYDEVVVNVNPPTVGIYGTWAGGDFTNPLTDNDLGGSQDGDGLTNLMEFGVGTDPTINDNLSLKEDGTRNGVPITVTSNGGTTYDFMFVRRDDYGESGSLIYTPQFSSDMLTFYDSAAIPTMVIDSSDDASYHMVKVPYPAVLINGQKAIFGRIKVSIAP